MKKFAVFLGFVLSFSTTAWADVCYNVNNTVATNAVNIIQKQKEIYDYCSICQDAEPKTILVDKVKNGNPVYVNGVALDLAHTYYKQGNKFINLGVASGCIKDGEYNIQAELESLPKIHRTKENDIKQAKQQSQEIFNKCAETTKTKEFESTSDMIVRNTKINDCLAKAIKSEIGKGFNSEQQKKMLETVNQIRRSVWQFYFGIYAENKYCYGACGTITNILPYIDEHKILMDMLEQVIYLNIAKNGY